MTLKVAGLDEAMRTVQVLLEAAIFPGTATITAKDVSLRGQRVQTSAERDSDRAVSALETRCAEERILSPLTKQQDMGHRAWVAQRSAIFIARF